MRTLLLILYIWGMVAALLLAGQLLRPKNKLSRLFGVMKLVWAMMCAVLGSLLIYAIVHNEMPPWYNWALLVSAFFMAASPTILLVAFSTLINGSNS